MDTMVTNKVIQRDSRGRFAKKSTEAAKVGLTKGKVKNKPTTVSAGSLLSYFDRNTGLPKKGNFVILKIINHKVPDVCRDSYVGSYVVYESYKINATKFIGVEGAYNYGYMYLTYTSDKGLDVEGGFPSNYQFELVDEKHDDHKEASALFDKLILQSLYKHLDHDFKIGCDPEIFVEDSKGALIPAFKFLPSKDNPARTPNDEDNFNYHGGCTMYWDGYQAEFTTKADHCLGYHGDSIAAGMLGVYKAARKVFKDAKLSLRSVFFLDPEELKNAKQEHIAFGCMPSQNAYGLKVEMPPARKVPFRSAGGHIHFGVGKEWHKNADVVVKALDAILGVACVSLFAEFDDPVRRKLYGLPGEYRTPAHGIEYRPLSNAWLCHPMIMNLVIDLSRKALMFGKHGFMKYWDASEEETINCIINCDVEASRRILERNKDIFKQLLKASYDDENDQCIEILYNIFINGVRAAIKDPSDFVTNWKFTSGWKPHSYYPDEPNVHTYLRYRHNNPNYKM